VPGNHRDSGNKAALKPNTTSKIRAALRASTASMPDNCVTRKARSARLSVPVTAYSKDTPIKNKADASRLRTT